MNELAELFSRDPRKHTNSDLDKIIAELRDKRTKFVLGGDNRAGAAPKLSAAQEATAKIDTTGIKL